MPFVRDNVLPKLIQENTDAWKSRRNSSIFVLTFNQQLINVQSTTNQRSINN